MAARIYSPIQAAMEDQRRYNRWISERLDLIELSPEVKADAITCTKCGHTRRVAMRPRLEVVDETLVTRWRSNPNPEPCQNCHAQ